MDSISWNIAAMDCHTNYEGLTNVVYNVHWTCQGTQQVENVTYSAQSYGTSAVQFDSEASYTSFQELTKEQVLAWIWASNLNKDDVEAGLQAQIDIKINPPTVTLPAPWSGA